MLKKRKRSQGSKHFKNAPFLKALGMHCQKLRRQKGYSIDRLSKESEQLSPSVIHRLESGSGAVTVSALLRYAQTLEIDVKDLLDFPTPTETAAMRKPRIRLVSLDDIRIKKEAFISLLPLYSAKAAAGYFGSGSDVQPEAWIEAKGIKKLHRDMFVVAARGNSMQPKILDGDYLLFKALPAGSKQGKIVLAQYRGPADPETGGSYTVKQYSSSKIASARGDWRHRQITLSPLNPDYEPIILQPKDESDFRIIGEYVTTLT